MPIYVVTKLMVALERAIPALQDHREDRPILNQALRALRSGQRFLNQQKKKQGKSIKG